MAAEMPARVDAADGAEVVDFPWSAATRAVAALDAAASTLDTQLDIRAEMAPTIDDWSGTYRIEFDEAYARITGVAADVKETLTRVAFWIVGGAEAANHQQTANNADADQRVP